MRVSEPSLPAGARARARAEITREIAAVARRHLAESGAAALSLRAVARELGMASSAVYRYFPSRDELLTHLIVDAFDAVGAAVEEAARSRPPRDVAARWSACCTAVRRWAREHPHEFFLVYGSPVPGYAAPQRTVGPASRSGAAMGAVLREAVLAGAVDLERVGPPVHGRLREDVDAAAAGPLFDLVSALREAGDPVPAARRAAVAALVANALAAWQQLFGSVALELSGHLVGVVSDPDAWFERLVDGWAAQIGLPPR